MKSKQQWPYKEIQTLKPWTLLRLKHSENHHAIKQQVAAVHPDSTVTAPICLTWAAKCVCCPLKLKFSSCLYTPKCAAAVSA